MALKQLLLTRKIAEGRKALEEAREKATGFLLRRKALEERESDLEAAVNEVTEATPDEDKEAVEALVGEHETEEAALTEEEQANASEVTRLEAELARLEGELAEINSRASAGVPQAQAEERKGEKAMEDRAARNRFGGALERLVTREDVKEFLTRTRAFKGEKRGVSAGELGIPDVMLELLRDNLEQYSKLINAVGVRSVRGTARQNIAGTIPEAIWTEAYGSLNELDLYFNQIAADGYKVGGFIPIPNALMQDSDLNLAGEIMHMLGQALGLAIDKAILYGTGVKMPQGIVTRLAQTAKPDNWEPNAPEWMDLHDGHLLQMDPAGYATDAKFFAGLIRYLSNAKRNYSNGAKFWVMNETTWNELVSKTVMFNAAGALVATQQMTMPIVGGSIMLLDFVPDYDIIGGYGSLYMLVERHGAEMAVSEHVRFLDDQTVFKATARYDGRPVFGQAFIALNINATTPTTSIPFAPDDANTLVPPTTIPAAGSSFAGTETVFLTTPTANAYIYYTTDGSDPTKQGAKRYGAPLKLTATTTIKAIARKPGAEDSSVTEAKFTKS